MALRRLGFALPTPGRPKLPATLCPSVSRDEGAKCSACQTRAAPASSEPFVHDWQALGMVGWQASAERKHIGAAISAPGQDRQDRLQRQPSPALVAHLTQTTHFGMMREIHFGGVLQKPHHRPALDLLARLLKVRLQQRENSSHRVPQAVDTRRSPLSRSAFGRASRPRHSRPCGSPLSRLVPSDGCPMPLARFKGLPGPAARVQDFLRVHLPLLANCKLCLKDRAEARGFTARFDKEKRLITPAAWETGAISSLAG